MRFLSLLFLSTILMTSLKAQFFNDTLNIIAYWSPNDTVHYDYWQKELKVNYATKQRDSTFFSNKVDFRVLEESNEHYMVEWETHSYQNPNTMVQFLFDAAATAKPVPYRYRTNEMGSFVELENFPEVLHYGNVGIDSMVSIGELNEGIEQAMRDELEATFGTPEKAMTGESTLGIQLFHFFYGRQFVLGDTLFYEDEIDLYGGDLGTADVEGIMTFYDVDTTSGHAYVLNRIEPNLQIVKRQTAQRLINSRKAGKKLNAPLTGKTDDEIRDLVASMDFEFYIERQLVFHYPTGYLSDMTATKVVRTSEGGAESWADAVINYFELHFDRATVIH